LEPGSGVEAAWSLRSGDGGIVLEKPVTVTGAISRSTVRGKLGPGGMPLRVQTGDGSIRLLRL
jgi:hypothetical protein